MKRLLTLPIWPLWTAQQIRTTRHNVETQRVSQLKASITIQLKSITLFALNKRVWTVRRGLLPTDRVQTLKSSMAVLSARCQPVRLFQSGSYHQQLQQFLPQYASLSHFRDNNKGILDPARHTTFWQHQLFLSLCPWSDFLDWLCKRPLLLLVIYVIIVILYIWWYNKITKPLRLLIRKKWFTLER